LLQPASDLIAEPEDEMACARISGCPLYKSFAMKSSLRVWKTYYCEGDFNRCERLRISSAGTPVPPNMLPNGRMLEVPIDEYEGK
jgi:hypothetical protein